MTIHRLIALGVGLAFLGLACAQGAAKPDKAAEEVAAAKERVERQASNPMRLILEAGKSRPKAPEAVAAVVPSASTRPAPEAAPEAVLNASGLQRMALAAPVAALERASVPAAALASLPALAGPASVPAKMAPKLTNMVEPSIPQRVLDGIGRLGDVSVDLTIRADGSVAAVAMLPPAPRQIQRYVEAALEQWRYEPLPAQQLHRVQLVFNP